MSGLDGLRETADSLIQDYGRPLKLHSVSTSGAAYDPTVTTSVTTVIGSIRNYKSTEIDGTTIKRKDRRVRVSAQSVSIAPEIDDRLTIDGVDHRILDVEERRPGERILSYVLQVRE